MFQRLCAEEVPQSLRYISNNMTRSSRWQGRYIAKVNEKVLVGAKLVEKGVQGRLTSRIISLWNSCGLCSRT